LLSDWPVEYGECFVQLILNLRRLVNAVKDVSLIPSISLERWGSDTRVLVGAKDSCKDGANTYDSVSR